MEILKQILLAILKTSLWEWLAVLSSLLYVILISYKHISAWIFAIISSALYIYICFQGQLYLESILNGFFLLMGIYGWFLWASKKTGESDKIIKWRKKAHFLNIGLSLLFVILIGFIFDTYTNQANPYTDSFTSIFSLVATFMVTKKVSRKLDLLDHYRRCFSLFICIKGTLHDIHFIPTLYRNCNFRLFQMEKTV